MPNDNSNILKIIKLLERTRFNLKSQCDIKTARINGVINLLKRNSLNEDLLTILQIATSLNSQDLSEASVLKALEEFENKNPKINHKPKGKVPVTKRIIHLIEEKKQFLHNKQIVELLESDFPELDESQLSQKLSSALSNLKKQDKLTMFVDGRSSKRIYWGKKNWLENGKIKSGFEYKKVDL